MPAYSQNTETPPPMFYCFMVVTTLFLLSTFGMVIALLVQVNDIGTTLDQHVRARAPMARRRLSAQVGIVSAGATRTPLLAIGCATVAALAAQHYRTRD